MFLPLKSFPFILSHWSLEVPLVSTDMKATTPDKWKTYVAPFLQYHCKAQADNKPYEQVCQDIYKWEQA